MVKVGRARCCKNKATNKSCVHTILIEMGTSSSRDHEVHVVVVQSQEGGQMDAKMIRGAYSEAMKKKGTASELQQTSDSGKFNI